MPRKIRSKIAARPSRAAAGSPGSRSAQRALAECADQDVGERDDRLRNDHAGVHRRWQGELDQAQTLAAGQVPPRLPAENGRGAGQDDPLDLGLRAGIEEELRAGS